MISIRERPNEIWVDCKKELDVLFKKSLVIDEEVVTERAHRVKTEKNKKVKKKIKS